LPRIRVRGPRMVNISLYLPQGLTHSWESGKIGKGMTET
jgi:hypothetical protein